MIEPHVSIVCACLPTLRLFIIKLFPILRSDNGYSASQNGDTGYAASSQKRGGNTSPWVGVGSVPGKSDGAIHMNAIHRIHSSDGSEEDTLTGVATGDSSDSGSSRRGSDGRGRSIPKTIEHSVEYSNDD
ncbi:hypothetical protein GMORB2_5313 [Geosmithia morbida]|uniref:Uncharacterized protein n=1 Tax=Geosmithia morbida TaxID=1094350 RepID=A0A9P4YY55_9HYPO|nr:uncharacterized protein GMORB2_5313 [Geosmithia morbida]KAF4124647.1 hypothetical protein GMORB2_5313 [Geosmithia morbida]